MLLLYSLLAALALWLPQNCTHEGAHCLVALRYGHRITGFRPWPKRYEDGSWSFASMRHEGPSLPIEALGYFAVAPLVVNTVLLVVLHFVLLLTPLPAWALVVLTGWSITNAVDGTTWCATFLRRQGDQTKDGWKLLFAWNLQPWMGRFIGALWVLMVWSWLLWWIYTEVWHG